MTIQEEAQRLYNRLMNERMAQFTPQAGNQGLMSLPNKDVKLMMELRDYLEVSRDFSRVRGQ